MTQWTLILTIVMNFGSGVHSEIERIDGFTSKPSCEAAGRKWKSDLSSELPSYTYNNAGRIYSWTCIGM